MNRYLFILFTIMCIGGFSACDDGITPLQSRDVSQELIDEYVAEKGLTNVVTTETGLNYIITEEGEGDDMPTATSTIDAHYKGYLTNGTVFDSTEGGDAFRTSLQSVISGWTEGFQFFKKNGKGILLIPPHLGYGANANGSIPGNSILVFEVELKGFF